jgi:hypothetical protein
MPTVAHPTHSHPHAGGQSGGRPKLYNPRHPERTLFYQTIAEHFETWHALARAGQFDGQSDHHTPKPYVRQTFRKYLKCGIFAHGFARAWCDDCGHDYFVAYSCKGRGVCPSCNTRRMVETAAHLTDHVFPRLAVRQWVLSVPKRLRHFMQRDGAVLNMVLRIFLRVIAQSLQSNDGVGELGVVPQGNAVPPKRSPAHYLWAVLIARIYEVFPLLCPMCGRQMRLIAFVTEGTQIKKILGHIGVDPEPPHIAPARGPPLWEDCGDAQIDHGAQIEPDWDLAAQPAPEYEVDQRISW